MKLALVGVGDAGTRIVDHFVRREQATGRSITAGNILVFNTDDRAFEDTREISEERQVLLGETHSAVKRRPNSTDVSVSAEDNGDADRVHTGTHTDIIDSYGVGGNPDVGATVAEAELPEIRRALDQIDETEVAATMLVVGLGGGTGSGVGSVLLEELNAIHETPVYVLGVLPSTTEPDHRALTAARGIRTLVPLADATFAVDNEAWRHSTDSVAARHNEINEGIVTRLLAVFGAGERDPEATSEMRVDSADLSRTLEIGGVTTIGYATHELNCDDNNLFARLLRLLSLSNDTDDNGADAATIKRLIRQALESKLTLPCAVDSADRVLLILSGPPNTISRKGFETGRYLLEEETTTVEVLAGDEPVSGATEITATVVLSNVTDIPRIDEIQRQAVATQPLSSLDDHDTAAGRDSDVDGDGREDEVDPDRVLTDDTAGGAGDGSVGEDDDAEVDDAAKSNAADSSVEAVDGETNHSFDFDVERDE
ncbi:tubulin/FtsZ family protein [Halorubrum sp. AJ67]|uniref:tubulin/FtsZ family protein n=1 Tax=Halorubrum sp. AJ67 TaxID=1173487 RepID=UPI0006937F7D|nr:tubulin/FtsZ family protein [Halorubrum sp. AJ67]